MNRITSIVVSNFKKHHVSKCLISIVLLISISSFKAFNSHDTMQQNNVDTCIQNEIKPLGFEETINGTSYKMVLVKGGTFEMGSKTDGYYELYPFEASVKDFYIAETELTQALWNAVVKDNLYDRIKDCDSIFALNCIGDRFPMFCVSWYEAKEFIEKLNKITGKEYRLPTETEWEYAAGGGVSTDKHKRTKWPGFESEEQIEEYVWYTQNSNNRINKVACLKPNYLGLYDMGGNVAEWCEDDFHYRYFGNPTNGQAWIDNPRDDERIIRGGHWSSLAKSAKICDRFSYTPNNYTNYIGFRLVLDAE